VDSWHCPTFPDHGSKSYARSLIYKVVLILRIHPSIESTGTSAGFPFSTSSGLTQKEEFYFKIYIIVK